MNLTAAHLRAAVLLSSSCPRPGRIALPCCCRNILARGGGAMPAETVERKLVAILAADSAGFSRFVGLDSTDPKQV